MRKLMFFFLARYYSVVEIKENETGRTRGMCGREEKYTGCIFMKDISL
jgi:hypothetical protein